MYKPIVGIPLGDPAGVGPEIVVKALLEEEVYAVSRPLVVGDARVVENALGLCQRSADLRAVEDPTAGLYQKGCIDLIDPWILLHPQFHAGYGQSNRKHKRQQQQNHRPADHHTRTQNK